MSEKALVVKIEFFEAHFKVHYTKGFQLTYPIPLPTTTAGIFAGLLGITGNEASRKFKDCKFGAILSDETITENIETTTFIQYGKNIRGVIKTHILINPSYYFVMQSDNIDEIYNYIENGIEYAPFGGQNDYFAKDWSIIGKLDVRRNNKINNYLYSQNVKELTEKVSFEIFPVMNKLGEEQQFYFIINGSLLSKKEMAVCSINDKKNVALYSLDDFYLVGDWSDNR